MVETDAKPWAVGDACPNCAGALTPVPAATPEQYAAAMHKEHPVPLPIYLDTADPASLPALGDLHRCPCGYAARVPKAAARSGGRRGSSGD
jgi:hypothetical protein